MNFRVFGPKGGVIVRALTRERLMRILPGLLRRFGRVAVEPTSEAPPPKPTARQLVVTFAQWGIAHEQQVRYAQIRPMRIAPVGVLPKLPLTTDCSGFATMCYRYSGAPDPNGQDYSGQGYTGTMLAEARRRNRIIPLKWVKPGDLVVFGTISKPDGTHVGVVVAVHARTYAGVMIASHGSAKGPFEISVAEEAKYQPDGTKGIVFLAPLGAVPVGA